MQSLLSDMLWRSLLNSTSHPTDLVRSAVGKGYTHVFGQPHGQHLFGGPQADLGLWTFTPGAGPCSVYIKNLPPEADKLFLYERFAQHGAVISVKVLPDETTGQCKGVGFVNYAVPAGAMLAVQVRVPSPTPLPGASISPADHHLHGIGC